MTRQECMKVYDELEDLAEELHAAESREERDMIREDINLLKHRLFLHGEYAPEY